MLELLPQHRISRVHGNAILEAIDQIVVLGPVAGEYEQTTSRFENLNKSVVKTSFDIFMIFMSTILLEIYRNNLFKAYYGLFIQFLDDISTVLL